MYATVYELLDRTIVQNPKGRIENATLLAEAAEQVAERIAIGRPYSTSTSLNAASTARPDCTCSRSIQRDGYREALSPDSTSSRQMAPCGTMVSFYIATTVGTYRSSAFGAVHRSSLRTGDLSSE